MDRDYIAFISYQHNAVDSEVAELLQNLIEHYIIPSRLRKGKKKNLGYVFRDEDELVVSSDLSDKLQEALDHSEYLIVLCSPEYIASKWCRREIAYFLKHHDIENILPVLVSGTPREAFPEEIVRRKLVDGKVEVTEPLAANVTAENAPARRKRVQKEYLRLVARLMECSFDELIQRQQQYENHRRMVVGGIGALVLLGFMSMLLIKNMQINARYLESLQNQARYVSGISAELMGKGDRNDALLTALAFQPENPAEGPLVPEQTYALSKALNAYSESYYPLFLTRISQNEQLCISGNNLYSFVYSQESVTVIDNMTGEQLWSFIGQDLLSMDPDIRKIDSVKDLRFLNQCLAVGDQNLLVISDTAAIYIDPIHRKILNSFSVKFEGGYGSCVFAKVSGTTLLLGYSQAVIIRYDLETGEQTGYADFNMGQENADIRYRIEDAVLAPDGEMAVIGFSYTYSAEYLPDENPYFWRDKRKAYLRSNEYFQNHAPMGLITFDFASEEIQIFSTARTETVYWLTDCIGGLQTFHSDYSPEKVDIWTGNLNLYSPRLYSLRDFEELYQGEEIFSVGIGNYGMKEGFLEKEQREVAMIWWQNYLALVDRETGSLISRVSYRSDVIDCFIRNGSLLTVVLGDGTIQHMALGNDNQLRSPLMTLDAQILEAAYLEPLSGTILLHSEDGLIHCNNTVWDSFQEVELDEEVDYTFLDVFYTTLSGQNVRCVTVTRELNRVCGVLIYPVHESEPVYSYVCENEQDYLEDIQICEINRKPMLMFLRKNQGTDPFIHQISLEDGSMLMEEELPKDSFGMSAEKMLVLPEKDWVIVCYRRAKAGCFDFSHGKLEAISTKLEEYNVEEPILTGDGKYLVWRESDSERNTLVFYDYELESDTVRLLPVEGFSDAYSYNCQIIPSSDSKILIYTGGTRAVIADCKDFGVQKELAVKRKSLFSFLGKNRLIVCSEDLVSLYDTEDLTLLSTVTVPDNASSVITDSQTDYFLLYYGGGFNSENDLGWVMPKNLVYYVDDQNQMYLQAELNQCEASLESEEVLRLYSDTFRFDHFYSYHGLLEKAQKLAEGKELSAEKRKQYFISEES